MAAALDVEQFKNMTKKEQHAFFVSALNDAKAVFEEARRARAGKTHGSAFLWITLCGKDAITKAFRAFVKTYDSRRVMDNYRGTKYAWYFGSQNDLGFYDGVRAMSKHLNSLGISCSAYDHGD